MQGRYRHWLTRLEGEELDGFLLTHPPNLAYLYGFTGSSGAALCLEGETRLLVDGRYIEQAGRETVNCQPLLARFGWMEALPGLLQGVGSLRLGFESRHLSHEQACFLQDRCPGPHWRATLDSVEELRSVKDEGEVEAIEEAFRLARRAHARVLSQIRAGMTEREVAGCLEFEFWRLGGQGPSFETIVASGPQTALPHASPSGRRLARDDLVLLDFGTRFGGYVSDMTRPHCMPEASPPSIWSLVEEAQQAALEAVRPGALSTEVDQAARSRIEREGYGAQFLHGTGHGLGLEVHELPRISPRNPVELRPGMVFTLEPGIYLAGEVGVRIEDAVLVTEKGCRLLSRS